MVPGLDFVFTGCRLFQYARQFCIWKAGLRICSHNGHGDCNENIASAWRQLHNNSGSCWYFRHLFDYVAWKEKNHINLESRSESDKGLTKKSCSLSCAVKMPLQS